MLQDILFRHNFTVRLCPAAGLPVAWKLVPAAGPTLMASPTSGIARRGGFATKNIWVTPHRDSERWPAGDYTIQSKGGAGLPEWTKQASVARMHVWLR